MTNTRYSEVDDEEKNNVLGVLEASLKTYIIYYRIGGKEQKKIWERVHNSFNFFKDGPTKKSFVNHAIEFFIIEL